MSLKETYHILLTQELIFNDKFLMQMKKNIQICVQFTMHNLKYIYYIYTYI